MPASRTSNPTFTLTYGKFNQVMEELEKYGVYLDNNIADRTFIYAPNGKEIGYADFYTVQSNSKRERIVVVTVTSRCSKYARKLLKKLEEVAE